MVLKTSERWRRVSDFVDSWAESGDDLGETDWRVEVRERMAEGDVAGMKQAAAPSAQWHLIKLAHETESEQLKLQALQFLLGQAGHGVVQKVESSVSYDRLPAEQLVSILRSKLDRLVELVPGFDPQRLLEASTAEAELVSADQSSDPADQFSDPAGGPLTPLTFVADGDEDD